ncbi:hypothetical protein DID88_008896 [Monilinia fructigena]|uniref:Uncharacterized protein n=1 Tax=Monilinia fructigena TaxID=38457 RepID=A0A395JBS3_9HELO|nr:hypothetical protein DID88_008896 [Monilinia fructigena]
MDGALNKYPLGSEPGQIGVIFLSFTDPLNQKEFLGTWLWICLDANAKCGSTEFLFCLVGFGIGNEMKGWRIEYFE